MSHCVFNLNFHDDNVKHFFMCISIICIFFCANCPTPLPNLKLGCLFYDWILGVLYILWITGPLAATCVSVHSVAFLLIFLTLPFHEQKFMDSRNFNEVQLIKNFFMAITFGGLRILSFGDIFFQTFYSLSFSF